MMLEQIVRLQQQARRREPAPAPVHVVVWDGVLDRRGETFSLHGTDGWADSQLANAHARVEGGSAGRVGAGVR